MKSFKKNLLVFTIILLALFINGCENKQNDENTEVYSKTIETKRTTYIFGIHPLLNSKKLFEVYQPMVDKINEQLENKIIKLESSINYNAFNKK